MSKSNGAEFSTRPHREEARPPENRFLLTDWRLATPEERLTYSFSGDPVTAYIGYPDIQQDELDKTQCDPDYLDPDIWGPQRAGSTALHGTAELG